MEEMTGKNDISIFVLVAPFLYGHLMLVVCPHQKTQLHTLHTQPSLSSYCGYPLSLYPSGLRMILAFTVSSLLAQLRNSLLFSLPICKGTSIKLDSYYLEHFIYFFLRYDHMA